MGIALLSPGAKAASEARTVASQFHPLSRSKANVQAHPGGFPGPVVYAAPTSRGVVNVYPGGTTKPKKRPLYSFSLDPGVENSLHVDRHGNLFFADSYSTWVYEYAPHTNKPLKSFPTSEPPQNIDLHGDTLYVFQSADGGGDASVQIYEKGQTQPNRALTDSAIFLPLSLAVDGSGNVFVAYDGSDFSSGVGEFVGGKMPMVPLNLAGVLAPHALAIDGAGNLLVETINSDYSTFSLLIYPPGQTTAVSQIDNLPSLYQLSLTSDGNYFYAGDSGEVRAFQMYAYPSGTLVYTFSDKDARFGFAGIGASPALKVGTW
jgi:hypothetical protein